MNIALIRLALLLTWTVPLAASDLPETFLEHLEQERFEQAHALFTESVAGALPAEQLAQIWRTLPDQLGEYSGRSAARVEQIQDRPVTVYRLEFAAMALDARISVDEDGQIDGFRLVPAAPQPEPSAATTSADWAEREAMVAGKLSVPIFLAQGQRDYQVTAEQDFARWKSALAGRAGVQFRLYESLNHLFMAGEGMATPAEYMTRAGHVDQVLVDDLAEFIEEQE